MSLAPASSRQEQIDRLYATYDHDFLAYLATATRAVGRETMAVAPLSDRYTIPKLLSVEGTPVEIGATIGHIARQQGRTLPRRTETNRELNEQTVAMYQRIYPQYLDLVRGVASVLGTELDAVDITRLDYDFFVGMWVDLLRYREFYALAAYGTSRDSGPTIGCSVASYYTGSRHLVGRDFDNPSDRPHYFTSTRMEGSYRVLGNVIYGVPFWVVDGINEKGFSLNVASNGEEYDWREAYPQQAAVFSGHMGRIVMDTCATVDEAIRLIGSVRVWFPSEGIHWLIADAEGRSAVIEFDLDRRMVVLDRTGPYELMTNTALQKGEDHVLRRCWRYAQARPLLEAGVGSTAEMLHIMRGIRPSGSVRTLWTSVMDLNNRSFELHYDKEYERTYVFGF